MEHKISNELPPVPNPANQETVAPSAEVLPVVNNGQETIGNQAVETAQSNPTPPQPVALQQPAVAPAQQAPTSTMPLIADDADLIEKEWVLKAKEIVARTSQDPYEQNKEVELMKADYMKKRYNKDIKITED